MFDRINRLISSRTDNFVLGDSEPVIDAEEDPQSFKHHTDAFKKRFFRKNGDTCCFIVGICVVAYLIGSTAVVSLNSNNNVIDLDKVSRVLHGSHEGGEIEDASKTMAAMLSYNVFDNPGDVPSVYNTRCRKIENQELITGKTFQGTSLPFLLEVMCQVIHQDTGCTGTSKGIIPRAVNASLLAKEFFRTTGRGVQTMHHFNTQNIGKEISAFSDLYFFSTDSIGKKVPQRHQQFTDGVDVTPPPDVITTKHYLLEDLCLITYKDTNGICYHYFNPDLKSRSDHGGRMVATEKPKEEANGGFFSGSGTMLADLADSVLQHADPGARKNTEEHTMLTIRSQLFLFLERHIVKIGIPVVLQYQPLIEGDYAIALKIDELSTLSERDEEAIAKAITYYDRALASMLLSPSRDTMWMRSSPSPVTFGLPPGSRAYQLAILSQILEGQYLPTSLFDKEQQ